MSFWNFLSWLIIIVLSILSLTGVIAFRTRCIGRGLPRTRSINRCYLYHNRCLNCATEGAPGGRLELVELVDASLLGAVFVGVPDCCNVIHKYINDLQKKKKKKKKATNKHTLKMPYTSSEGKDQHARPHRLIKIFSVRHGYNIIY